MSDKYKKLMIWAIAAIVVIVTTGFIILGIMQPDNSGSSDFTATTAAPITSADHTEGNPNAKVTLIEYGDFQCPACGAYFPLVQQLFATDSSTVLFVFRNFPLSQHPDAQLAAQAAEAAALQGKYWQMHDLLYTDQGNWPNATPANVVSQFFDGYASTLGLNVAKFNTDIASTQVLDKIQNDVNSGNAAQINHTPTFFINLQQIQNPTSYADFQSVITQALAAAGTK